MGSQSISSSSASFFEPSLKYKEENTMLLYNSIKMNLQEIERSMKKVDANLNNMKNDIVDSALFLNAIQMKSSAAET